MYREQRKKHMRCCKQFDGLGDERERVLLLCARKDEEEEAEEENR